MQSEQEFNLAVEQYLNMVYRIALNWFGSVHDAEDAAQEVMLRLWKNTSGFEGDAHLRHWLVRVTINVCKDLSRAPWRLHSVPLAQAPPQPCANEPEAQAVVEEILRLPKKYRVPLYLYHYEGYSVREISALLKANPSTIRTRLSRARELLKHQLEEG
ncbi:MAG TPA: RNA polymerase sigma factor [Candidatus Oscillibacter excrementavium]|nr:RNA polymerase sigma factor [Candidatus Oscillibacter excrementavium]